jgi:hypothetical protein
MQWQDNLMQTNLSVATIATIFDVGCKNISAV